MAFTTQQLITQLYVGYYNRAPDPEGLNYWIGRVNAGVSLADIADSFAASPEAIATYPFLALPNVASAEAFLNQVYLNLFNRPIDDDGKAYYANLLATGQTTPGQIIAQIQANANTNPNNTDGAILANKVDVGLDWALSAASKPGFTYDDAAANSANTVLTGVTENPATVAAAKAATDTFFDTPNVVISLTTGLDTIQGTTADELIRADHTTLQATDTVDGGAGRDVFEYVDGGAGGTLPAAQVKNVEVINIRNASGSASTPGTAESANVTFAALTAGQTIIINGITYTADAGGATADQVANAVVNGAPNAGIVSVFGAATVPYTIAAIPGSPNSVTYTANAVGNQPVDLANTGTGPATVTVIQGTPAVPGTAQDVTVNAANFVGAEEFNSVNSGGKVIFTGTAGSQAIGLNTSGAAQVDFSQTSGASTTINVTGGAKLGASVTNTNASVATANLNSKGAAANEVAINFGTGNNVSKLNINADAKLTATLANSFVGTGADAVVTGASDVSLTVAAGNGFKSIDAEALVGGLTVATGSNTASVKGGAGKDDITLSGLAANGAVSTGAGDDTVKVNAALAAGTKIELGAGNDKLLYTSGSIANSTATATTVIDGGDGIDTLALQLVGAANVGVFKNFEVFDVIGMTTKTLDMDILATNNTVTGITASGALAGGAAVTLNNLGADVGFTALASMGPDVLTLSQKTAGALTVTLDVDKTTGTPAQNDASVSLVASNATSLKAVFDSASNFVQTAGNTNDQVITLSGTKATTLEVVSGGTNATNVLNYTIGNAATPANDGLLTSATVSGSQNLSLNFTYANGGAPNTGVNKLATVDAAALTGKLTFALEDLANGGTVILGSGADLIAVNSSSTADGTIGSAANIESIVNFTKSTSATNADAIALADKLDFGAAITIAANGSNADTSITDGVLSFVGTGPTTLEGAVDLVNTAVGVDGAVVVFKYLNDSYAFQQDSVGTDVVVKLAGLTDATKALVDGGDLFLV